MKQADEDSIEKIPYFSIENSISSHFFAQKARKLEICRETWLPRPLGESVPSFWTSEHPERQAKDEHEVSTEKIPCFSIENSLSGHFLAENARLLEICWETWLSKALDQTVQSFWTSQHPERLAKQEHEESTEKIPCFSIDNSVSGHFFAEKARPLEICWQIWLPKALDQSVRSFWTSHHPECPTKEEHEDSKEKISCLSIDNSISGHFFVGKARPFEICWKTGLVSPLGSLLILNGFLETIGSWLPKALD